MPKTANQTAQGTRARLPANARKGKVDLTAMHKRISKRFPKVLAELAK